MNVVGELERLASLKNQGLLTDEEFASQKMHLLSSGEPNAVTNSVSDTWAWLFVCVPLFGLFFEGILIANDQSTSGFVGAYGIGHLIAMILDQRSLKRGGFTIPLWKLILGYLLPPIYLSFRARALKRGYKFIWLWLAAALIPSAILVLAGLAG